MDLAKKRSIQRAHSGIIEHRTTPMASQQPNSAHGVQPGTASQVRTAQMEASEATRTVQAQANTTGGPVTTPVFRDYASI